MREVVIHKELNHPNIIKLIDYEYKIDEDKIFVAMELADTDLKKLIDNNKLGDKKQIFEMIL